MGNNRQRTIAEAHDALHRMIQGVWREDKERRSCFTIPVNDSDADIILDEVIRELESARLRIARLEAIETAARDLMTALRVRRQSTHSISYTVPARGLPLIGLFAALAANGDGKEGAP